MFDERSSKLFSMLHILGFGRRRPPAGHAHSAACIPATDHLSEEISTKFVKSQGGEGSIWQDATGRIGSDSIRVHPEDYADKLKRAGGSATRGREEAIGKLLPSFLSELKINSPVSQLAPSTCVVGNCNESAVHVVEWWSPLGISLHSNVSLVTQQLYSERLAPINLDQT